MSLNLERNWYWRKKYLVIETACCVKTLCLEKRPWLVEIGTSRSFSSKSIRPMNWLCEYGSDPHCRVLACTASSSGEQAETGVPWRVPVVHGRTTPWECHPAVDMTSHNHPAIGCFGLSTQPIWDIWQEMSKDWGLGLNLPMVTADEHQAPLCTQRQSTDTTYAAELSIVVVLQFIHHTSQVHVNTHFRYIPQLIHNYLTLPLCSISTLSYIKYISLAINN